MQSQRHKVGGSFKETLRFVSGRGNYIDDLTPTGSLWASILRSPYAHAKILGIDASAASRLPGVEGILLGKELASLSKPFPPTDYYPMATDRARFVGEPIAIVAARKKATAETALELIDVQFDPQPAVVDAEKALAADTPILHEKLASNLIWHRVFQYGDVENASKSVDRVVSEKLYFHRYSSTPIECFGIIASYDSKEQSLTIRSNSQGYFDAGMVEQSLGVKCRFIINDSGGGFGIKGMMYPYMILVGALAIKVGKPVKWIETRREHFLASSQHADRTAYVELGLKKSGRMTVLKIKTIDNAGAYLRPPEPAGTLKILGCFTGCYKIDNIFLDANYVVTNKCPTGPNRGYGSLPHSFMIERVVDIASKKLGFDPADFRVRNFIGPKLFPYTTPSGGVYDSGDYPKTLQKALDIVDYPQLRKDQARQRQKGRLLGIGISTIVEPSATNPNIRRLAFLESQKGAGSSESVTIRLKRNGRIAVATGITHHGQCYQTAISQIVAEILNVEMELIQVETDFDSLTSPWTVRSGTYASRFASIGVGAVVAATRHLVEKLKTLAANFLKAKIDEVTFDRGMFSASDGRGKVSLGQLIEWHFGRDEKASEIVVNEVYTHLYPGTGVPDAEDRINTAATYSNSANIAVVEVEPETGVVKIKRFVVVHDCGRVINHKIVEGQIHGGVAHGIGGALYEEYVYDDSGQLLTVTFTDYPIPTANEIPKIEVHQIESPSPYTVLGAKGAGESGAVSSLVSVINAVEDALSPFDAVIRKSHVRPNDIWAMTRRDRIQTDSKGRQSL